MRNIIYNIVRFLKLLIGIGSFLFVFKDTADLSLALIFTIVIEIGLTLAFWGIEDED